MGLRGWSHDFLQQIQDGGRRHITFRETLMSLHWMKTFAHNLVQNATRP